MFSREENKMITNSRYITLFDSATSAYSSNRRRREMNWWLPSDEQQTKAMTYGSTTAMYRLLFGDVPCLPRNQVFDSPVFYNIVEGLKNVNQEWFIVSVLTQRKPTPLLFVAEVAEQFSNKNFLLSAWPGLDRKQRINIYKNIKRTGNFKEMLLSVGGLSGQQLDISLRQQELLQHILEYLELHPESLQKSFSRKNKPKSKSLWNRLLDKDVQEQLGANAQILQTIPKRIKESENINNRGVLYKYIADFVDVRDTIREVIDQQYHYILAESVAKGRIDIAQGLFSKSTLSDQNKQVQAGDAQYGRRGLKTIYAHTIEDKDARNISSLNWVDIAMILNDKDFQQKIAKLRHGLSISKGEEVRDVLNDHCAFLEKFIPSKVFTESDDITLTLGFLHLDKKGQEKLVKIISGITGPFQGVFEVTMDGVFKRIQNSLNEKRKSTLAGRIRDWLRPLIDEEGKNQTKKAKK